MTILYIAIFVVAVVFVIWLIRLFMNGRKRRHQVREFQQDIAMQERIINPDDDTATWPILPSKD